MRIIQLIDSLEAGGAERMAVSYANALSEEIEFSALVATRKEGPLLNQIEPNVPFLFLNKKSIVDFQAIKSLRSFVKKNKVTIIHAHSASFFLAFLVKVTFPAVQLIWHDHYGDSEFLDKRPTLVLRLLMPFFSGTIAVNHNLEIWSKQELKSKNTIYLPNFPSNEKKVVSTTFLKGITGKRILCLANLRVQKNHFLLLNVAKKLKESHHEWTFHLVGKDFDDLYSQKIKELIVAFDLEKNVFLYGTKDDVENIIQQSNIGVLTSDSEGLPLSLLEYGRHKKAVVVTNVGAVSSLVTNESNGFLVEVRQEQVFYESVVKLILNETLRNDFGIALYSEVLKDYSEKTVLKKYLKWLQNNYK